MFVSLCVVERSLSVTLPKRFSVERVNGRSKVKVRKGEEKIIEKKKKRKEKGTKPKR
jgi:hypothetical protein